MKRKQIKKDKREKERYVWLKALSTNIFGSLADKYKNMFKSLKKDLLASDVRVLFRTYLSIVFFLTSLMFVLSLILSSIILSFVQIDIPTKILLIIITPIASALITFTIGYFYPAMNANSRKLDIEANLPFAITHMSAISSSGVPPHAIFKILSKFKEYGEISDEAGKIVRNIEIFGLDEITAIREVMAKTPSRDFKELLEGILSTIQTGGNLQAFLREQEERAIFNYKLERERHSQTLSVYADFYTALLIAAPLLFIVILSILSIIGGQIFGLPVYDLINIGVFGVIPILNLVFLLFVHLTQPKM